MAEVMKFDDFKEHGSEAAAKVKCLARIQGIFCYDCVRFRLF